MPFLARVTLVALLAYTALAMALEYAFDSSVQFSAGPVSVYLFDLLLFAVVLLLVREFMTDDTMTIPAENRLVLFLVLGYCAYQIAVVLPVAVMGHNLDPVSVVRDLENRLALLLIPFMYLVALKYLTPRRLVLLVNITAVLLALYAVYKYLTVGPIYDSGFRLRELWGGSTLLFAFLVLTALFLVRSGVASYVAAIIGLVGIALTNHRSGYVALIAVAVPLFFHFRRASLRTVVLLVVIATGASLVLAVSPAIRQSTFYSVRTMFDPTADQTSSDRLDRSRLGWDYFVQNPVGDYAWSHRYYLVDLSSAGGDFEPHNFVVQLLAEQGIVGFAFFAAISYALARIAWRNRKADRISAVMLAYLAFYLIFNLFNTNLMNQWNVLLLAVPAGVILQQNALLQTASLPQEAAMAVPG